MRHRIWITEKCNLHLVDDQMKLVVIFKNCNLIKGELKQFPFYLAPIEIGYGEQVEINLSPMPDMQGDRRTTNKIE